MPVLGLLCFLVGSPLGLWCQRGLGKGGGGGLIHVACHGFYESHGLCDTFGAAYYFEGYFANVFNAVDFSSGCLFHVDVDVDPYSR